MANTTTRTRKAATAKKAPAKKAAPAHVRKQAAKVAEMVPAGPDKPKKEQSFEERDWTYLDEKDPSEQHVILAKEINKRTNLEDPIDPKHVQAVLAMFPHFQRSQTNKSRSGYVPLAAEIVEKRSEHMTLAHKEAREIMDGLVQESAKATKKTAAKAPAKKATPAARKTTAAKKAAPKADGSLNLTTGELKVGPAKKTTARKARVTKPATPAAAEAAF